MKEQLYSEETLCANVCKKRSCRTLVGCEEGSAEKIDWNYMVGVE